MIFFMSGAVKKYCLRKVNVSRHENKNGRGQTFNES